MAQLLYGEGRFFHSSYFLSLFYGEPTVSCGTGASAQAALPAAHGIHPADQLAAHATQVAGGQATQAVQQVVGQEALPAAEHMAWEIQPTTAQVPQQAVAQAQH